MNTALPHALLHPNVPAPARDWSERQTLHVACAYTNPCRWNTRRSLLNDFRRHMAASPNVRLYVGEIAYGDRPFEVTEAAHPLDLQFRTRDELWHKENLLNRIVASFPPDWRYGAYVDGDFHFTRHDWALEAVHLLQHYDWVQLFSSYTDLGPNQTPVGTTASFMHNYLNKGKLPRTYRQGAPGGAWAFRREAFDATGGLLDTCILGAADWHMALGLMEESDGGHPETTRCGSDYTRSIRLWQARASALGRNVGCVPCHAIHHYHGPKSHRGYGTRWQILARNQYNPWTDLRRDWQGLYALTPGKPNLRDDIRAYFRSRNEDSIPA